MKKFVLVLLAALLQNICTAQPGLLDSAALANYEEHNDLKEAMTNPLDVVNKICSILYQIL